MSKFQIPKIKTQEEYIANMQNLVKQYPFHMGEINQLLPYSFCLAYITFLGPAVEFLIREVYTRAFLYRKIDYLKDLTLSEFLSKIRTSAGKGGSLIELWKKLEEKRKNSQFRESTPGYEHYFFDYLESTLEEESIVVLANLIKKIGDIRNKTNHGDWGGLKITCDLNPSEEVTILQVNESDKSMIRHSISSDITPISIILKKLTTDLNNPNSESRNNIELIHAQLFLIFNQLLPVVGVGKPNILM